MATLVQAATPTEFEKAINLKGHGSLTAEEKKNTDLRTGAVREEAVRYGIQTGFAWRYGAIARDCESRELSLDRDYPFDLLLLEGGTVQPPVITKADNSRSIENGSKMTATGKAWRILQPAMFVSNPPSWRTYLLVPKEALEVQAPHSSMLPKTSEEREVWKNGVTEGWNYGVEQAERTFRENVARLSREFNGMAEYHKLNRQGKISIPNVSKGHYAVRVGKDTLELDQQTFVINEAAQFQGQNNWHTSEK